MLQLVRSLTLPRVATLAVGIVLLISGLGTTTFWVLKAVGKEQFVPFGLSTFRSLDWVFPDVILAILCLSTAVTHIIDEQKNAPKLAIATGVLFIVMGLLGCWIDLVQHSGEKELQPMFLNVWFIGWGLFCVCVGHGIALTFFDSLDKKMRMQGWLPVSVTSSQGV